MKFILGLVATLIILPIYAFAAEQEGLRVSELHSFIASGWLLGPSLGGLVSTVEFKTPLSKSNVEDKTGKQFFSTEKCRIYDGYKDEYYEPFKSVSISAGDTYGVMNIDFGRGRIRIANLYHVPQQLYIDCGSNLWHDMPVSKLEEMLGHTVEFSK